MAELKTKKTAVSVDSFLKAIADDRQRVDALELSKMMADLTGQPARMWGPSMVGFGENHYVYDSGHEGDIFLAGFSPRKGALVLYFNAGLQERFATEFKKLGKRKASKGCLYIKRLSDVDGTVLRKMIKDNVTYLSNLSTRGCTVKKVAKKA
jgi:hypothetical protein